MMIPPIIAQVITAKKYKKGSTILSMCIGESIYIGTPVSNNLLIIYVVILAREKPYPL